MAGLCENQMIKKEKKMRIFSTSTGVVVLETHWGTTDLLKYRDN